jgi:hypothetical protein
MREQAIQALAESLSNNLGQTLTSELATGIATRVNQALQVLEKQASEDAGQQSVDTP